MNLQPHPFALIIPPMSPDEYRALKADIKANGLEQPLTLYEGKILDGVHRNRACMELGIEPATREWRRRNGQTPMQYVLSMNGHRRHLSPGQKAVLAVELATTMRKMYPCPTGGPGGDVEKIAAVIGADYEVGMRLLDTIAPTVGAGQGTVNKVQTLAHDAPRLYQRVRDGSLTVQQATRERSAAEPKLRKSAEEINNSLLRQLERQLHTAADTAAKLEARKVELAGAYLLTIWGYAFTVAATIKTIAKNPSLPETRAGAQRLLTKAADAD